jgi:hypothetical protein
MTVIGSQAVPHSPPAEKVAIPTLNSGSNLPSGAAGDTSYEAHMLQTVDIDFSTYDVLRLDLLPTLLITSYGRNATDGVFNPVSILPSNLYGDDPGTEVLEADIQSLAKRPGVVTRPPE